MLFFVCRRLSDKRKDKFLCVLCNFAVHMFLLRGRKATHIMITRAIMVAYGYSSLVVFGLPGKHLKTLRPGKKEGFTGAALHDP